jgi:hypothetical protein
MMFLGAFFVVRDEEVVLDEQARLPNYRVARPVRELKVGESAFTSEDALLVDSDKKCWLYINYIMFSDYSSSYPLEVTKDEGGWIVDISGVSERSRWWATDDVLPDEEDLIEPVIKLIDFDDEATAPCGIGPDVSISPEPQGYIISGIYYVED